MEMALKGQPVSILTPCTIKQYEYVVAFWAACANFMESNERWRDVRASSLTNPRKVKSKLLALEIARSWAKMDTDPNHTTQPSRERKDEKQALSQNALPTLETSEPAREMLYFHKEEMGNGETKNCINKCNCWSCKTRLTLKQHSWHSRRVMCKSVVGKTTWYSEWRNVFREPDVIPLIRPEFNKFERLSLALTILFG